MADPEDIPVVTGNIVVDKFLAELDIRCDGGRGTPPDSAARLKVMRPLIRVSVVMDPEKSEAMIRAEAERLLFDVDEGEYRDE